MIVQFTRYEGTDHEVRALEGLMHRWRLMDTPGYWLEVVNVENPGILAAIPTHGIYGVEVKPVARDDVTDLDTHLKVAAPGMRYQLFRPTNVALTVGGVFQ